MEKFLCKFVDIVEEFFLKIFEKIGLKKFVEWYRAHKEGMRYLVFGGLAFILSIAIFSICKNLCNISTIPSNVISWIITVLFAYITNKLFVFYSKVDCLKNLVKEILYFFGARVFTLVVENAILKITVDYYELNSILMKMISNILVIILNFVFSKLFIFNKNDEEKNIEKEEEK